MKNKPPKEQISEYANQIIIELERWKDQYENGCNDPAWSDGVNLNLLRNHIIYYKVKVMEICEQNMIDLPEEYFLPIPPYVDSNYFAKPKSERAARILRNFGRFENGQTASNEPFNDEQIRLFD